MASTVAGIDATTAIAIYGAVLSTATAIGGAYAWHAGRVTRVTLDARYEFSRLTPFDTVLTITATNLSNHDVRLLTVMVEQGETPLGGPTGFWRPPDDSPGQLPGVVPSRDSAEISITLHELGEGQISSDEPVRVWARLSTGAIITAPQPKPVHPLGLSTDGL